MIPPGLEKRTVPPGTTAPCASLARLITLPSKRDGTVVMIRLRTAKVSCSPPTWKVSV